MSKARCLPALNVVLISLHVCICSDAQLVFCWHVDKLAVSRLQGRIAPAEAAQIHRMQAKQEEKAELEAILEQVRYMLGFWLVGETGTSACYRSC